MIISTSLLEYLLTIGISGSFALLICMLILCLSDIKKLFKDSQIKKQHIVALFLIMILFVSLCTLVVKPTQQLFFDDAIYQGMAQDLIHTGQAWMCNYGTPYKCFVGQSFHEPIGESFDLAIGFAIFGVKLSTTYNVQLFVAALSVIMIFLIYIMLFNDATGALLSALFLSLSPVLLMWSRSVTSDLPFMTYSLVAIFCMLVFAKKKSFKSFSLMLASVSILLYMKVNAIIYLVLIPLMYIIIDDKGILDSIKNNFKKITRPNAKYLVVFIVFLLLIFPEFVYFGTNLNADYGASGTYIQQSCKPQSAASILVSSNNNLANFKANICTNILFWFNKYNSQGIMQPIVFTAFAILGVVLLCIYDRRNAAALSLWFIVPFLLYVSFYAGAVTYGVDWRFMLSLIAQTSIFAGFAGAFLVGLPDKISSNMAHKKTRKDSSLKHKVAKYVIVAAILALMFYSIYALRTQIGINPYKLQAADARFYENFVYTNSSKIPNSCIVLSYDPTLFNINNKTSAQLFYAYNSTAYSGFEKNYSCVIVDWGYWCYTPNNLCTGLNQSYVLSPIATATYSQGKTYGLYEITQKH